MPPADDSPASLFPAHFAQIAERHAEALAAAGYEGLLLHSGMPPPAFLDDQHYPFRPHPPFKVWVPQLSAPDCFVYVEPGRKPRLLFVQPLDYWHKAPDLPAEDWTDAFDVRVISCRSAARTELPADLGRSAYIGEPFAELLGWGVAAINPEHLLTRLDFARAIKTPYEIEMLRIANRIGARGHRAAEGAFRAGATEFEIELQYLRACGQREQELPYNPIIALNEGAAVLHYQVLERAAPRNHDSLLIDAGASYAGYGSDITRTYSLVDADFAELIAQMDHLQLGLCAAVRAGTDWRDIHMLATRRIAELLCAADILRANADEAVDRGLAALFFPHGIGHLLGLQVHDVGGTLRGPAGGEIPRPESCPALRLTRRLEPGYVVTMEPGIYFIDALLEPARADGRGRNVNWQRVASLRRFGGIRVEDDLVATNAAPVNLTREAFAATA